MLDFLLVLWSILIYALGLVWSIIWFILRDLLSTLLWIGIVVYIALVARHRSFSGGALALLRYARYGARLVWQWLRGGAQEARPAGAAPAVKYEYRERVPLGYVSASQQMNVLLVALIALMASL